MTGVTKSGFTFEIADEKLDDYELFEKLCEVDNGNCAVLPEMLNCMLGKEQVKCLKEHIREKEGRITVSKMMEEVGQILQYNDETKN